MESVVNTGGMNRLIAANTQLAQQALGSEKSPVQLTVPIYTQETDGRIIGRQAAREIVRALAG
jgi:hypothetical protein